MEAKSGSTCALRAAACGAAVAAATGTADCGPESGADVVRLTATAPTATTPIAISAETASAAAAVFFGGMAGSLELRFDGVKTRRSPGQFPFPPRCATVGASPAPPFPE
jgi:hypothetical protein